MHTHDSEASRSCPPFQSERAAAKLKKKKGENHGASSSNQGPVRCACYVCCVLCLPVLWVCGGWRRLSKQGAHLCIPNAGQNSFSEKLAIHNLTDNQVDRLVGKVSVKLELARFLCVQRDALLHVVCTKCPFCDLGHGLVHLQPCKRQVRGGGLLKLDQNQTVLLIFMRDHTRTHTHLACNNAGSSVACCQHGQEPCPSANVQHPSSRSCLLQCQLILVILHQHPNSAKHELLTASV